MTLTDEQIRLIVRKVIDKLGAEAEPELVYRLTVEVISRLEQELKKRGNSGKPA